MQFKGIILISTLLAPFNLVKASNKRKRLEQNSFDAFDESISETEILSINDILSSSTSIKNPGYDITSNLRQYGSNLKGTRPKSTMRRVSFDQSELYNDFNYIKSPEAEQNYFKALDKRKFGVTHEMRKQGLMISGSNFCLFYINSVLRSGKKCHDILNYLLKNYPNVFYQDYDCGHNVFHGASQFNINFLIERTGNIPRVHMMIFKEALRNPNLILEDDFYKNLRPNRACEMIELAETSKRSEMIEKCYILPGSLFYFDLDGETFFTKAILNRNLNRIKFLISRPDAIEFILTENLKLEQNCIDLAIKIYDNNLDPYYSVILNLFPVISYTLKHGNTGKLEELLDEFVDNIVEADYNEILFNGLETELISAKNYIEQVDEEVEGQLNQKYALIELLNQKFVEIFDFRSRKKELDQYSDEISTENTSDEDGDDSSTSYNGIQWNKK